MDLSSGDQENLQTVFNEKQEMDSKDRRAQRCMLCARFSNESDHFNVSYVGVGENLGGTLTTIESMIVKHLSIRVCKYLKVITAHFNEKENFFFGRLFGIGCFVVNKM